MLSDQDDIWLLDKVERSVNKLEKENADLVFSDLEVINQNEELIAKSFWKQKGLNKKIKKDKAKIGLRLNNYITGCTILSKKKFLEYILPIPTGTKYLIHDFWIAIVISLKGKIEYIEDPLIKYRQHQSNQVGSKMKSKELKSFEEIRDLFINVKIELFSIYCEHSQLFTEKEREKNKKALKYYQKLRKVKNINFGDWILFGKLYYYENTMYKIANFVILNMPLLAKFIYKRR